MKRCSKCKVEKPFEEFYRDKNKKDGRNGQCKSCINLYQKSEKGKLNSKKAREKYRSTEKGRLKVLECTLNYQKTEKGKQVKKECDARYRKTDKCKVSKKKEYEKNKSDYIIGSCQRRALKIQATPSWLTDEQKQEIIEFYKLREILTKETGILHHVDHIIPLKGDRVCGLHVPWNLQVIPASENLSKSNKLLEELLFELDSDDDIDV